MVDLVLLDLPQEVRMVVVAVMPLPQLNQEMVEVVQLISRLLLEL